MCLYSRQMLSVKRTVIHLLSILRPGFTHMLKNMAEVIWTLDSPSVQAM